MSQFDIDRATEMLRAHLSVGSREDPPMEQSALVANLRESLSLAGTPPDVAERLCDTFDGYVQQVNDARAEYDELREQLDGIRASSARRIGRVTRLMHEIIHNEAAVCIWIDDEHFLVLPADAEVPHLGQTVQFALGTDGDAAYFGSYGYEHVGLVSARLKAVQPAGEGRTHVELELRDGMAAEDTVVAIASAELEARLADLKPGDRVRVTDGKMRIAYPAPASDEAAEAKRNPLYSDFTPRPAEQDNFIYSPAVLQRVGQILKVLRHPAAAAEAGLELPQTILFAGPSGCGKTTIAERLLAREVAALGYETIRINTDQITSEWYGRSEKLMREALTAGYDRNVLIIMNEVDAVMRKRGAHSDSTNADVSSRVFAVIADAIGRERQPGEPHRLIALTSNYQARLDSALLSRLSDTVQVGLPDRDTSARILTAYLAQLQLDEAAELVAEMALCGLDFPLIRLVFDSSDHERVFMASDALSGRTIELSVQAAARAAFYDDTRLSAFSLARELKRQLHANVGFLGAEDLGVALGLPGEEAHRVTGLHVDREALLETCTDREIRMRFRNVS